MSILGSALGQAFVEIVPDTGGFASKMKKEVGEAVDEATAHTSGAFNKLAGVGQAALLGLGTAAVGIGVEAVHLADVFEASHARLETAVANTGKKYEDFSKSITAADKTNEKFGLTADQTEGALARLTQGLNDPKKALDDLGLAVNIAAARHIDLETAATLVGKVASGNTTILKRYGIDLDVAKGGAIALGKAHDAVTKASEALAVAQDKAGVAHQKLAGDSSAVTKAQDALTAALDKAGVAHGNAAQMAVNNTKAQEALMAASKAMTDAQTNVAKVQADIASGHIKAADAAAALQKANDAASAASTKFHDLQMSQMAARSVADDQTTKLDAANKSAIQKAQENLAAAVAASHDKMAAAGTKGSAAVQAAQEKLTAAQEKLTAVTGASGNAIAALTERFSGNAQSQAETFKGKIAALEAQAKDLGIQLGMVLVPIIEKVVSAIYDGVQWFEKHKVVAEVLAGVVATVLVVAIGAYIASMIAATAATVAAAAPVLAVVAGIALLAAGAIYLYKNVQPIHDLINLIVADIKSFIYTLTSGFTQNDAATGPEKFALFIRNDLWPLIQEVAGWIDDHWKPILIGFGIAVGALVAPWALVVAGLIIAYEKFGLVRDIVDALAHVLIDVLKGSFETVKLVIENTIDTIKFVVRVVTDVVDIVKDIFTGKWQDAWDHFKDIPAAIIDFVSGILGNFLQWFGKVPGLILDAIGNLLPLLYRVGSDVITGLWNGAVAISNDLRDWLISLPGKFLANVGDLGHVLWGAGGALLGGMWDGIKAIAVALMHWFIDLPGNILSWVGDLSHKLWGAGAALISGLGDGVVAVGYAFRDWFLKLPGNVVSWIGDIGRTMAGVGSSLIKGILRGIVDAGKAIFHGAGFIGNWAYDNLIKPLLDALGVSSPSKVWMGIGANAVKGLAQGLADVRPITAAMGNLSDFMVKGPLPGLDFGGTSIPPLAGIGGGAGLGFGGMGEPSTNVAGVPGLVNITIHGNADQATVDQLRTVAIEIATDVLNAVSRKTTQMGPA